MWGTHFLKYRFFGLTEDIQSVSLSISGFGAKESTCLISFSRSVVSYCEACTLEVQIIETALF